MTVNFYIDNEAKGRAEKAIYCNVREAGQTLRLHTGERILPKHWDASAQKAKRSFTGSFEFNQYLANFKEGIWSIVRQAKIESPFITFDSLKMVILREVKHTSKYDLISSYQTFLDTKRPVLAASSIQQYEVLLPHLQKLNDMAARPITLDTIDLLFLDNMRNYFITLGVANSTTKNYFIVFKVFLRWCFERGFTKNNNFEKYRYKMKNEVGNIALTWDEVQQLENAKLSLPKLVRVRDIFFFQLYTGQRISDVLNFSINDVRNDVWYLKQKKTSKIVEIPLISQALEILAKYNYEIPQFSTHFLNVNLKMLGKEAGLNEMVKTYSSVGAENIEKLCPKYELLSTHVARRTFVSLACYSNINSQVIKSYTGHSTEKLIERYFKVNAAESRAKITEIFNN